MVATIRALKLHGGVKKEDLKNENLKALEAGMINLARHVENVKKFGIVPVVSINRFSADTDAEIALVKDKCKAIGVEALMADHWAMGGEGAADVARAVVKVVDGGKSKLKLLYPDDMPLVDKIRTIASRSTAPRTSTCTAVREQMRIRADGLRQPADLHRQDAVFVHHQPRQKARRTTTSSMCARCGSRPAPSSWWRSAGRS